MIERALSIRQPWAWAILRAGKRIENRDWKGHGGNSGRDKGFRGEFYIHASMAPTPRRMRDEIEDFIDFVLQRRISLPRGAVEDKLTPRGLLDEQGGIVGIARVVDIRPNGDAPTDPWAIAGCLGIVLADVRPVPFVPCKGALGWWKVPADVLAKLREVA